MPHCCFGVGIIGSPPLLPPSTTARTPEYTAIIIICRRACNLYPICDHKNDVFRQCNNNSFLWIFLNKKNYEKNVEPSDK